MESDTAAPPQSNSGPAGDNAALPSVVISLDFELRWGLHDRLGTTMQAYRQNLEGVQEVVPALLRLFSHRKLRATWACVGALACASWDDYFSRAPAPPRYHNPRFALDPRHADLDPDGRLHFAPELLQLVKDTPGQEMGTHTFSHIYMQEPGIASEDVAADLQAVSLLWTERFGAPPTSLVFPRNQHAFLPVIAASSSRIWRGPEAPWFHSQNRSSTTSLLARALRLIDSVNPLVRHASHLQGDSSLLMTRASLFLRANLPRPAWALHLMRIRRELDRLRPGEIFHLWWHPHNLGKSIPERLGRVEQVLDLVAEKRSRGLLESQRMEDLVPVKLPLQ